MNINMVSTTMLANETQDQYSQHSTLVNLNFIEEYLPESQEIDMEYLK